MQVMKVATRQSILEAIETLPLYTQRQILCERISVHMGLTFMTENRGEEWKRVNLNNDQELKTYIEWKLSGMRQQTKLTNLMEFIEKPDRLQMLDLFSRLYMFDEKEYGELLHRCWTVTDFPHQMTITRLTSMFDRAKKEYLMSDEDKERLSILPEQITVYRGYSEENVKAGMTKRRGLSWTTDYGKALWFASRFNHPPIVLQATAPKELIYMYTDVRGEKEVVINPKKLVSIRKVDISCHGFADIAEQRMSMTTE